MNVTLKRTKPSASCSMLFREKSGGVSVVQWDVAGQEVDSIASGLPKEPRQKNREGNGTNEKREVGR